MKTSFAAAILPILALAALPAPVASAQTTAFQCMATSAAAGGSQLTIYVSELIPMDTNERAALNGAWGVFVKANYHLDTVSSSVCQPLGTDSAMQQRVVAAEMNAWQKKGLNVVQVKWIPGQAPKPADSAPAATAAPPAPSAPEPAANQGPQPRAQRDRQGSGVRGFVGQDGDVEGRPRRHLGDQLGRRARRRAFVGPGPRQGRLEPQRRAHQRLVAEHGDHLRRRGGTVADQRGQGAVPPELRRRRTRFPARPPDGCQNARHRASRARPARSPGARPGPGPGSGRRRSAARRRNRSG